MRKLRELLQRQKQGRNDDGFNMLELIMVVVVIGILGGIGFAIYRGVSGNARDAVLTSNISTAATELVAGIDLEPGIVSNTAELQAVMADRTEFAWTSAWNLPPDASEDAPNIIRFQWLNDAATAVLPDDGPTPPTIGWLRDGTSAVRLRIRNDKEQWACALIVLKTDQSDILTAQGGSASDPDDVANAKLKGAELRGVWYDSGDGQNRGSTDDNVAGAHDCSPVHNFTNPADAGLDDSDLPADANSWDITVTADQIDGTGTTRTLTSQP